MEAVEFIYFLDSVEYVERVEGVTTQHELNQAVRKFLSEHTRVLSVTTTEIW
jgi:hypothetical protein